MISESGGVGGQRTQGEGKGGRGGLGPHVSAAVQVGLDRQSHRERLMKLRVVGSGEELESAVLRLSSAVVRVSIAYSEKVSSTNVCFAWAMLLGIAVTVCPRSAPSLFSCGAIGDEMNGLLS